MIKKIESFFEKNFSAKDFIPLTVIIILFTVLRFPSLIEPHWYGDEGIYEIIGMAIADGRILYSEIWDNKPPLLYLIYALFNGDQFSVRLASLLVGIFSVFTFYLIAKKLFKNLNSVVISTVFFAIFFALPTIEGNIANAENFMILPTLISLYILLFSNFKNKIVAPILAGLILSLAFLTKIVAIFDFAAFCVLILITKFLNIGLFKIKFEEIYKTFKEEIIFIVSFAIPIVISVLYFFANGAVSDYFRAAFSQNVGYVGYGNYFLFPMGELVFKLLFLAIACILLFRFRKSIGSTALLIFIWIAFSLFNTFFSSRPYTHYVLVLLPAFSLLLGLIIENKQLRILSIVAAVIIAGLVQNTFRLNFKKIIPYYSNYASFISGQKSPDSYQTFFDRKTPSYYELAEFINMKTDKNENIFIWGDAAQIYALANKIPPGRYTVSYHITFYKDAIEETKLAIDQKKPKLIIQLKEGETISNFLDGYELRYKIGNAIIYERQY